MISLRERPKIWNISFKNAFLDADSAPRLNLMDWKAIHPLAPLASSAVSPEISSGVRRLIAWLLAITLTGTELAGRDESNMWRTGGHEPK